MGTNENKDYEDVCMICHRTESVAGKMYKMGGMCVCPDCMRTSMDMLNNIDLGGGNFNFGNFAGGPWPMPGFGPGNNQAKAAAEGENATDQQVEKAEEVKSADDSAAKTDDLSKNDENKPDEGEKKEEGNRGVPRFSFLNLGDFGPEMLFGGNRPKVKKRTEGERKPLVELKDIPAPHKIKEELDQYVVGQEHAKKVMSVAVYNHYKRVATDTMDDIQIEKSNMLLIGPTGSGKTYLVKTLAKMLNVPLAITDATSLTEAGYIGDDIESVVSKLLAAADNDVDKAEQGIIFIDEIDKIAKKQNHNSRDVSGESVQQGMLKLLEGSDIEVPVGASSKNVMVPTTTVNTRNILFICGGAFSGLDEIIKRRLKKQTSIGFNAELKDKYDNEKNIHLQVTIEDLKKFGMIPEFIGRLPMICGLESLTEEMLVNILKEPKNAIIKQYQKLLRLDEVDLQFTEGALKAIAQKAMEKDTGARALRAIIDEFMLDIMYEIPKDENIGKVTITEDYINKKGGPIIELRSE